MKMTVSEYKEKTREKKQTLESYGNYLFQTYRKCSYNNRNKRLKANGNNIIMPPYKRQITKLSLILLSYIPGSY